MYSQMLNSRSFLVINEFHVHSCSMCEFELLKFPCESGKC